MSEWSIREIRRYYHKLLSSTPPDMSLNDFIEAKVELIKAEFAVKNINKQNTNDNN